MPISPASTIHRLLGSQGPGRWIYNEINKLEADLIILDEASMVDSEMFHRLLFSVSTDCRIVAIGDHGQLAPVGPGSPFSDFVEST
ncbi:MAG: AAA family ATPase, partial [candidate division Zixibacteria bacterium]|nr:AAA family ATPase [candidate division Zixibacteria bacterium]NIR64654.1 AAA family ATPase [candidate division Zixibacteria bacterium]NIS46516.1 AAA family ATPase [candidate division Zixibacteria bacterium]NIT53286.1 AAA family ATPase [candidate division Zixibacteria bacterium]NIU14633.1 AAA family ATPase [candidate division Zixibacteria bacterium]